MVAQLVLVQFVEVRILAGQPLQPKPLQSFTPKIMSETTTSRPPCPTHLNWLTTYLTVESPERALDFYTNVFDFKVKELRKRKGSDRILFARLSHNGSDIMIGPQAAFGGRTGSVAPVVSTTQSPVVFYVYCDDADSLYEKFKQDDRIDIITPIETTFWGDRVFKICCPEGYYWDFATNVSESDLKKAQVAVE